MLPAAIRYKLHFGRYKSPRFKLGATVEDEIRGKVRIVGISDARIPWPLALNWRQRSVVVYGALARAMRLESVQAIAYWWGISVEKVRIVSPSLGRADVQRRFDSSVDGKRSYTDLPPNGPQGVGKRRYAGASGQSQRRSAWAEASGQRPPQDRSGQSRPYHVT